MEHFTHWRFYTVCRDKPACCGGASPCRKGASNSILTSSLAWDIAGCSVKRRLEALVGGLIELRKIADQDADSLVSRRKTKRQSRYLRVTVRSCVIVESPRTLRNNMHENQEISSAPSRLSESRSIKTSIRTGHARAGEAGLCRRTCEPAEQSSNSCCGGGDAAAWSNWKDSAKSSLLASFAKHLCRDEAALLAALQQPWNNGPVEGHVHRLKLIKRSMYGRAKFDLLRLRVVNTV